MNNLISVIVPIYNVEAWLNQCIKSIVSQTYQNIEILLIDDGSTDSSGILCDEWKKKDSRIKVIHKVNGGLSDARNAGISIANGEFITFIDSDDIIEADMIEYLVTLINQEDIDMSVCQKALIDESGNLISPITKQLEKVSLIKGRENCMRHFLSSSDIDTVAWGKLYKTSMFDDVRYPMGRYHEDVFTTYKLIAKCNSIAVGSGQKYFYRIRQGSITQTLFSQKHMDAILGKEEQAIFIQNNFPNLYPIAQGDIVYACNQCIFRLAKSDTPYQPFVKDFKSRYSKNIKSYLHGNYRMFGKLFALLCRMNPTIVIKSIRMLKHLMR